MKRIFAILLTFSFLLQCSAYVLIYADFAANRDYIAKNLCENRDKPDMKCNGKCQLCKRLKDEDKKENKGLPANKNLKQNLLFSSANTIFNCAVHNDANQYASYLNTSFSSLHKQGIFHPPLG